MQSFCYTRHQKKETLIDFLVRRFPYQDRNNWIEAIQSGAIKVNGEQSNPKHILTSKEVVSYERPRSLEPPVDDSYNILFLDESILVVEKNGNIPIAESGRYYRNTLINILKEKEGYPELYQVHRLDKETSGVLLVARTKETATILGQQFVNQIPKKTYHTVLQGELNEKILTVDQPLKKCTEEQSRIRIRQVIDPAGKPSKTLFETIAVKNQLTLSKVKTFTGRTHQIRCHAEFIGHPILGDKLYGQADDDFLDFLKGVREPSYKSYGSINRQLLHASRLSFLHPLSGEELEFTSDFRQEFSAFPEIKKWLNGLGL